MEHIDSFNKSHATAYAIMTYNTAWLKYYYPQYFYASLLTAEGDDQTKVGELIAECKRKEIRILPPHINESTEVFKATREGIRYRITTIRNIGDSAITHIKELRPIQSLSDLLKRGQKKYIKKNVVEMAIKAGCFDFENPNREELLGQLYKARKEEYTPKTWNNTLKLEYEKESLGIYLTSHPLDKYYFKPLAEFPDQSNCLIAGEVLKVKEIYDKKGRTMAFITIGTPQGNTECIAFAKQWNERGGHIKQDMTEGNIVMIRGKRDKNKCIINESEVLQ